MLVSSYLTFSLSPVTCVTGYLVFCGTFCYKNISIFAPTLSGGGSPYVARTFLHEFAPAAIEQLAFKFTKNKLKRFHGIVNKILSFIVSPTKLRENKITDLLIFTNC